MRTSSLKPRPLYGLPLAFLMVLSMMAGLFAYGIQQMTGINEHLQEISLEHNAHWDLVTHMRQAARERTLSLYRMIATDDPFSRDEQWMRFKEQAAVFIENRSKLLRYRLTEEERALLMRQNELSNQGVEIQNRIVELALAGKTEAASRLLREEGLPAQNAVFEVLHELYELQEREIEAASTQADDAYRRARTLLIVFGLFALGLGAVIAVIVTQRNRQQQYQLFREKALAQITLHSIADGVVTTDAKGRVQYLNTKAEMLLGIDQQAAFGTPIERILRFHGLAEPDSNLVSLTLDSREKQLSNRPMTLLGHDNSEHSVEYTVAPIVEHGGYLHGAVLVFHDVTDLRRLTEQLSYHASHDTLTGLINRREFEQRLQMALESARNARTSHTLCYLDLDQFKVVNDTCGHLAGDELLKQLTDQLKTQLRTTDTLARLGGDEFAVLLENCPVDKAEEIAEKIRATVKEYRFTWEGKPFEIGVSIGLVPIDAHSGTLYDLLRQADTACFIAKDLGRNRTHRFHENDQLVSERNGEMQWIQRIQHALQHDRLALFGQRIIPLKGDDGQHDHYEILLRLRDEQGQIVPPMAFIPAAERYNLMPAIDRWVISKSFELLGEKQSLLREHGLSFTINLSGQSINEPGFIDFLTGQLRHAPIEAQRICFELTETAAIVNLHAAKELITAAKEYGARFALDDFGTGFSSFAYLKNLPVDLIKIDGSFVQHIAEDEMDRLMVESMHRTAALLDIQTVAEYVESAEVLAILKEIGIDYAQGWHIGQPQPMDTLFDANAENATAALLHAEAPA